MTQTPKLSKENFISSNYDNVADVNFKILVR